MSKAWPNSDATVFNPSQLLKSQIFLFAAKEILACQKVKRWTRVNMYINHVLFTYMHMCFDEDATTSCLQRERRYDSLNMHFFKIETGKVTAMNST